MAGRLEMPLDSRRYVGYHGTSTEYAQQTLRTKRFHRAVNPWDWLGHGIYFWENNLDRAILWAKDHYGANAAVLRCEIDLMRCLDLSNAAHVDSVRVAYNRLARAFATEGRSLPVNTEKNRALDCLVLNYLADKCLRIDTVRCPFHEGLPIFEGSQLLNLTHIQLVVRSEEAIKSEPVLCFPENR